MKEEPLGIPEQRSDRIRLMLMDHSGCCVKDRVKGTRAEECRPGGHYYGGLLGSRIGVGVEVWWTLTSLKTGQRIC